MASRYLSIIFLVSSVGKKFLWILSSSLLYSMYSSFADGINQPVLVFGAGFESEKFARVLTGLTIKLSFLILMQ